MNRIILGAIGPALIVAALQCLIDTLVPIVTVGQPFEQQLAVAMVMIGVNQSALLLGAIAYAGFLRCRSSVSLAGCALGGAAVGFLANLVSEAGKSVFICLVVAFMFGIVAFKIALVIMVFSCSLAGIGGLILGEIGGGAVGLLSRWRSEHSVRNV